MVLLLLKVLLAPGCVVLASLVARRFGPWIGGLAGGLPVVAGPILLVYAVAHGARFAAAAATASMLGLVSLIGFVVVYGHLARRCGWRAALMSGWLTFLVCTALLSLLPSSPVLALAIVALAIALARSLLPRSDAQEAEQRRSPRWDLPLRAGAALALVLVLTATAGPLGPRLSGLLTPFPVIGSVLTTFTHRQRGSDELLRLLRGLLAGYGGFGLFCFTVSTTLVPFGVGAGFGLASLVALCCQGIVLQHRRLTLSERVLRGSSG